MRSKQMLFSAKLGDEFDSPVPKKVPKYEVNHMMETHNKRTRHTGVYKSQHSMSTRMCCNQYNVNNNMNCNENIVTDLSAGKNRYRSKRYHKQIEHKTKSNIAKQRGKQVE